MNSEHHIARLFKKYVANDCTLEEAAVLIDIIRSGENKDFIEALINESLEEEEAEKFFDRVTSGQVFKKLDLHHSGSGIIRKTRWIPPAYLKIAAAVAVILVSSFTIYSFLFADTKRDAAPMSVQDIGPGGNRAVLFLADGQQVVLNDAKVGNITEFGGVIIKKPADGLLAYSTTGTGSDVHAVNTVKTPKGGQYQVVLPDGSKVWLNAASSITYPASFNTGERHVVLTGEGYFEITPMVKNNKKVPFIVETGKQKIEVLGTRFNVNAYDDEKGIKTTLIEGKVKVMTETETIILKPSQEFNLWSEGISTKKVDVETAIDWKNGDFIFADEDIKSVMRKVARWYNVDVVYESVVPDEKLSGQISRNRNLSEVLRMLELSGDTKFKIENGSVHISYQKL